MTHATEPGATTEARAQAGLGEVRDGLRAAGVHGGPLDEALEAIVRVGEHPRHAAQVRADLLAPAPLLARLQRAVPRRATGRVLATVALLGALVGPLLALAALSGSSATAVALGDPRQGYTAQLPRAALAVVGVVLLVALLLVAARYRRPGLLGLLAGLAGAVLQLALATLPWLVLSGPRTGCDSLGHCTVSAGVPAEIALAALLFFGVPFTIALAGACSLVGLLLQRRRLDAAVRAR